MQKSDPARLNGSCKGQPPDGDSEEMSGMDSRTQLSTWWIWFPKILFSLPVSRIWSLATINALLLHVLFCFLISRWQLGTHEQKGWTQDKGRYVKGYWKQSRSVSKKTISFPPPGSLTESPPPPFLWSGVFLYCQGYSDLNWDFSSRVQAPCLQG